MALVTKCLAPAPLPEEATAQSLVEWTIGWMGAYGCEKSKREALIASWPQ